MAFQSAKTITPSTTDQIAVSSGYYTGGDIIVKGDSNLVASNIKNGINIFGVSGTLEEGVGGDSSGSTDFEKVMIARTISKYTNAEFSSVGQYAFAACTSLTSVNFAACETVGSYAFIGCTNLDTMSFPACTRINNYAFSGCTKLTSIYFPVCSMINYYGFANCSGITTANLPVCNYIHNGAFSNCSRLTSLTLGGSTVATLNNVGAFKNTPISVSTYTGTFGSIYVLASLVDAYKSATNWATYADRITAINSDS